MCILIPSDKHHKQHRYKFKKSSYIYKLGEAREQGPFDSIWLHFESLWIPFGFLLAAFRHPWGLKFSTFGTFDFFFTATELPRSNRGRRNSRKDNNVEMKDYFSRIENAEHGKKCPGTRFHEMRTKKKIVAICEKRD